MADDLDVIITAAAATSTGGTIPHQTPHPLSILTTRPVVTYEDVKPPVKVHSQSAAPATPLTTELWRLPAWYNIQVPSVHIESPRHTGTVIHHMKPRPARDGPSSSIPGRSVGVVSLYS
ncbi:Plasma membrane proteolipid 3 [Fusarium oxysporum f. sp. albedinis]|nr:Plasma membrane proteolipid 3 [Fusarium oxysporum f. sp. albedinis]